MDPERICLYHKLLVMCLSTVNSCSVFFVAVEPNPPVRDFRFSVGQLPAWAKKQVGNGNRDAM